MNKNLIKYIGIVLLVIALGALYFKAEKETVNEEVTWGSAQLFEKENTTIIYVHVCGAVASPGVYEFTGEERIFDAIERAGGMTLDADTTYLNMAKLLTDGMKLYVPTKEEVANMADGSSNIVNINTASVQQLTTLPGIGQSKAEDIVNYRNENGEFQTIEDIMNIPGIKEAAFNKIKDYISV